MVSVAELAREAERSTDVRRLDELGRHRSTAVRIAVAENSAAGDETVGALLRHANDVVRLAAAGNVADRPALHSLAVASEDRWVRAVLADAFALRDDRSLP